MRNAFIILAAAVLMAGAVFAQNQSESVESVLKELTTYSAPTPATQTAPTPVAEAVPVAEVAPVAEVDTASAEVAAAMPNEDVPVETRVEENQEEVPVNEFVQSQQGLPDVVQSAPENIAARLYRRTLLERDHRAVEVDAMEEVKAAWSTDLVLRSYVLAAGARECMKLEDVTGAVDVGALFPLVDFPQDSSAIYQPDTETIFVRNTQQNLAVLETILETMGVLKNSDGGTQVEIEAKFVEVSEGTLEELGFQWNFDGTVRTGIEGSDVSFSDGANGLFADALRGSPTGSSPMPFSTSGGPDGSSAASGDWRSFRIADTFNTTPSSMTLRNNGSTPLDVVISALDQSSGADVLSAPRIVTKSGEEATIRVGERHYFPEVFEGDTDQATMLTVAYQDFEEKLLGIELVVTPEVNEDQITLALNPRIIELAGWQNYQLAPANSIYNHRQNVINLNYTHDQPVVGRLPIFKKREIQTEVQISDGSTIGMGGLISEKIEAFEDKVPVLGSLPLVGRFFRNEGERAVKRNLLMFVTAKIMEPTGRINTSRSFE